MQVVAIEMIMYYSRMTVMLLWIEKAAPSDQSALNIKTNLNTQFDVDIDC